MTIETVLYLINIFGNISMLLVISALILFGILVILGINCGVTAGDSEFKFKDSSFYTFLNILKSKMKYIVLVILLACFIPSEKTMYLMLGVNYFKNLSLPPKIELIIEKKLEEYIKPKDKTE